MQTVCKKVMLTQGELIRRMLASGVQAPPGPPVRLMDSMLNMHGVCGDDSEGVWDCIAIMRQCVCCGQLNENEHGQQLMPVADCCGLVHYCDRECQGDHAAWHKPRCHSRLFQIEVEEGFNFSSLTEGAISKMITRDDIVLSDIDCKERREFKIAYSCACALNFMQQLSTVQSILPPLSKLIHAEDTAYRMRQDEHYSKFFEWWKRHTHMEDSESNLNGLLAGENTMKSLVFVATFNDLLGCLSFMALTLDEMVMLFDHDERIKVVEIWNNIRSRHDRDRTDRAVLAVAFNDHGFPSDSSKKGRYIVLPLHVPSRPETIRALTAQVLLHYDKPENRTNNERPMYSNRAWSEAWSEAFCGT